MLRILFGYAKIKVRKKDSEKVLNLLGKNAISFTVPRYTEEGIEFSIGMIRYRQFKKLCDSDYSVSFGGIPNIIHKYRKRYGIFAGAILFAVSVLISQNYIWNVNVTGNKSVSDKYIIDLLDKLGCGVGKKISDIDFDLLNNKFLIESEGIRWISVNMNGTYANVEVREINEGVAEEDGKYYNLIASEDGKIVKLSQSEGKPLIKLNDTVCKGDLLVSAVSCFKEDKLRFESAEGSIFAEVMRSFSVSVPVEYTEKVKSGESVQKKTVTFFNFPVNLFLKGGNSYRFYDTITSESSVYMFGVPLPVNVKTTRYDELIEQKRTLSETEVKEIATAEYRKKLAETLGDARLLSKKTVTNFDGKNYTVNCDIYCIADIAKKREVFLDLSPENERQDN